MKQFASCIGIFLAVCLVFICAQEKASGMYCCLNVSKIRANTLTHGEPGSKDEVYFNVRDYLLRGAKITGDGNEPYKIGVGMEAINIILWRGFLPEGFHAKFIVDILESDTFGSESIGAFEVTITAPNPTSNAGPIVNWAPVSNSGTYLKGPSVANATKMQANGSRSDYMIDVNVTQPVHKITNVNSGLCLDVVGVSMENNANVQQFNCHGGQNQRWCITRHVRYSKPDGTAPFGRSYVSDGDTTLTRVYPTFFIFAAHSGKCLDVELAGPETNVQQSESNRGLNQGWFLLPTGVPNEYYIISNKPRPGNGFALDVVNASHENNANVQIHAFHGGANQKWRIDPAPESDSR